MKSKLTLARETAALAAGRELLFATVTKHDWNLSATAVELELANASQVIRALRDHGLEPEYLAAKAAGKIAPGPRAKD